MFVFWAYRIHWRDEESGVEGHGKKFYNKKELKDIVRIKNQEYPFIRHEVRKTFTLRLSKTHENRQAAYVLTRIVRA